MFYEAELRFLCDTLQKCHIQVNIIDMAQPSEQLLEDLNLPLLAENFNGEDYIRQLSYAVPGVLYRVTDPLNCHYLYCSLPSTPRQTVLSIGPYLTGELTTTHFMEWAEQNGIPPAQQKYLYNYYSSTPMVHDPSYLFAILDTFGEQVFGTQGFRMEDLSQEPFAQAAFLREKKSSEEDPLWRIRALEQRYSYENELIDAVSKGQTHKADILLSSFSHFSFEQRVADPLRNAKNYCIIMNTLLRKAAEQGKVHPLHLDDASSAFALRIEQAVNLEMIPPLMVEMFHAYCRLVRKHSLKNYSPPVQRAISLIEADPAGNLNLRTISHSLNISSSYLSSLFKKETGQTLTEHIVQCRISLAKHLLKDTKLQVQTVAQHCGIMDVHYFSKLFKKATGMTPKAYRQSLSS